jgi:hypothetical protein
VSGWDGHIAAMCCSPKRFYTGGDSWSCRRAGVKGPRLGWETPASARNARRGHRCAVDRYPTALGTFLTTLLPIADKIAKGEHVDFPFVKALLVSAIAAGIAAAIRAIIRRAARVRG